MQPVQQGPPQCGTFLGPTQLGTSGSQRLWAGHHQDQGQAASWNPNCGQNPPMPFSPQQPHQQAISFSNLSPAVPQPHQVLPHYQPQTCPQQQQFPLPQAPCTAPVQALPAQPLPIPSQQQPVIPKPTATTPLPTSHPVLQASVPDPTGLDLKTLGDRLDAALEKKFENMAESLKLSLTPPTSSTPPALPASMARSTQETPTPALEASTTSAPTPFQSGGHQGSHQGQASYTSRFCPTSSAAST